MPRRTPEIRFYLAFISSTSTRAVLRAAAVLLASLSRALAENADDESRGDSAIIKYHGPLSVPVLSSLVNITG